MWNAGAQLSLKAGLQPSANCMSRNARLKF
jgi:hypothetical protein